MKRRNIDMKALRTMIDSPSEEHARLITPWAKRERFAKRVDLRRKGFPLIMNGMKKDLHSVSELIDRIQSITEPIIVIHSTDKQIHPYIHKHKKKAVNIIRGYSADQIIKHGSIPVPAKPTMEPVAGCHPQSLVLHKALRLLGFKPRMVQEILPGHTHTAILFEHEGKTYYADTFLQKLMEATPEILKAYKVIPTRPMSYTRYRKTIVDSKLKKKQ